MISSGKNKAKKSALPWSEGRLYEVLRKPVLTEKTTLLAQKNKAVFEVAIDSVKPEIKAAVEKVYNVKVQGVHVIRSKGKQKVFRGHRGVRKDVKKAIVTLLPGQNIDIWGGA